jgi:hypothetical protein
MNSCARSRALRELGLAPDGPLGAAREQAAAAARRPLLQRHRPSSSPCCAGRSTGSTGVTGSTTPGELKPVVVSYYANDAFEIRLDGATLFEAVRKYIRGRCIARGTSTRRRAEALGKHAPRAAQAHRDRRRVPEEVRQPGDQERRPCRRATGWGSSSSASGTGRSASATRSRKKHDYWPEAADVKRFVAAARKGGRRRLPRSGAEARPRLVDLPGSSRGKPRDARRSPTRRSAATC